MKKKDLQYIFGGVLTFSLGCMYALIALYSSFNITTLITGGMTALTSYICGFAGGRHYMKNRGD